MVGTLSVFEIHDASAHSFRIYEYDDATMTDTSKDDYDMTGAMENAALIKSFNLEFE